MGVASQCKRFFDLACCVLVASALPAPVIGAEPSRLQHKPPPQVKDAGPKGPALPPIELWPGLPDALVLKPFHVKHRDEAQKAFESSVQWIRWIVIAIVAALGSWGVSQALRNKPIPPREPPKPRTEELGLGADGKGGVWRREVYPWQE
jgi:hypothetical protein